MATFNLISEPWVPVIREDGSPGTLGLRDVLTQAHRLRGIRDPLPTAEFGLYRLLVALVLDMFQPEDTLGLGELLGRGSFDAGAVGAYFGRNGDRFDLFHPQWPFLQMADMGDEAEKPVAALVAAIPSGTNATHFHHAPEAAFGIGPEAAARLLTTIAPFMTAGGAGLSPSINGAPPWYVLVTGATLFETLCLNACVLHLPQASGMGIPAWRSDDTVRPGRRLRASLLESLTWQPRRIRLLPGRAGRCALTGVDAPLLVRTMQFSAGASCDFSWTDPNVPYRIGAKGPVAMRAQAGRALWRDTGPIALLRAGDYESDKGQVRFERPLIVSQVAELADSELIDRRAPLRLTVYGMRTDMKMKIFEWQRERLTIPAGLIRRGAHCGEAQQAMERADAVAYDLARAIKHVYPRDAKGNKAGFDALVARAQRGYWESLRPAYGALLQQLAGLPQGDAHDAALAECRADWERVVCKAGHQALDAAIGDLDTDAAMLQRQVEARRKFRYDLYRVFHPHEAAARRKGKASSNQPEGGVTI